MAEYHITIKGSRLLLALLAGIAFAGIIIFAAAFYVFIVYEPLEMLKFRVNIDGQPFNAHVSGSLPIDAKIDQVFSIPIKQSIPVRFPFHQQVTIPFDKSITVPIEMDTTVPISMIVPFKSEIVVDTEIFIDTNVQTRILGIPFDVPIKGHLPVHMTIPIEEKIPVRDTIPLKVRSPVKAYLREPFQVPIDTVIIADIPLDTQLNIPFRGSIHANASMDGKIPNLFLLDNTVDINMNQLQLLWQKSP